MPGLKLLMKEKKYMSNDIVAEMEKMLILTARQILRSINGKQFFAIIADESADISKINFQQYNLKNIKIFNKVKKHV